MGKAGQFGGGGGAVVSFGQGDAQHLGGDDGVFAEGFVEVAYTE